MEQSRQILLAGNWKMNKTVSEATNYIQQFLLKKPELIDVEFAIFPPYTGLSSTSRLVNGTSLKIGAQDVFWASNGAFTGEISSEMIAEFCDYVIVGHSERRDIFGETDEIINKKILAVSNQSMVPILCVGESLVERKSGHAVQVVQDQIQKALPNLELQRGDRLVVAYEPKWAIGTGENAKSSDVKEIANEAIRPMLISIFGNEIANNIRLLYGGSVTRDNAKEYFSIKNIDGALIGGASLSPESLISIAIAATS